MREIISIGECMVELARRADNAFDMRVGGDTFNTAIYLARLGASVAYMSAIGDDPYSAQILQAATCEGVDASAIYIANGRMPGLYLIETLAGERSFWYWRERSPARELFELAEVDALTGRLAGAGAIYLSGITLSLYSETGLTRLETALLSARANGCTIAMDGNFRPTGWHFDTARARAIYERFWRLTDIALPSFDDEQMLWGDCDPANTFDRLASFGVGEICLKRGHHGAMVMPEGAPRLISPVADVVAIDTTAAGDSFSAAYLWARLSGHAPSRAAVAGNRLAAIVIQHPGAIVPAEATNTFSLAST